MAVLALGLAGSAIGTSIGGTILGIAASSIGATIGAGIGALVDSVLFSSNTSVEGSKLDDLSVTSSAYGAAIPLIYGPRNRVTGNVIWSTGLVEHVSEEESGGKGGSSVTTTTYTYSTSVAVAFCEGEVASVSRIWANGDLIYDDGSFSAMAAMRFYGGGNTQTPDASIQADRGDDAPAYRHTCYIVLQDLQLADFGNVLPSIEAELVVSEEITLAEVVKDICLRAGCAETDVSVSKLTGTVDGLVIDSGTPVAALQTLAAAYAFSADDHGGQIRFRPRGLAMRAVIPIGETGTVEAGTDSDREPIQIERTADISLPREVAVSFYDYNSDYETGTQPERRRIGSANSNITKDLPVTMEAAAAKEAATRLLYENWAERKSLTTTLSDRWRWLLTGDTIGLPVAGVVQPFRITRLTRGANAVTEVEAVGMDMEVYSPNSTAATTTAKSQTVSLPGITRLILMDCPILRDEDDNTGFYFAVAAESSGWKGATILRSADDGETYSTLSSIKVRTTLGDVADALASGPTDVWDLENTLTVVLAENSGTLSSTTRLAVLNGANAAWLGPADGQGGEILQFQTATLTAENTYVLSGLLRGRLGTETAVATHEDGEVFVLLSRSMGRSNLGASDLNRERLFKPVSLLTTEADTAAQSFTNGGSGVTPLSPVHPRAWPQDDGGLLITWIRRSRLRSPGLGYGTVPVGEETEAYEIDILNSSGTVLRTLTATAQQVIYSAEDRATDGTATAGTAIALKIYQVSATVGRGNAGIFTVRG